MHNYVKGIVSISTDNYFLVKLLFHDLIKTGYPHKFHAACPVRNRSLG
jgi:hypothetical protein